MSYLLASGAASLLASPQICQWREFFFRILSRVLPGKWWFLPRESAGLLRQFVRPSVCLWR